MLPFKHSTWTFLLLAATAQLLTACTLPESQKRADAPESAGTFMVEKADIALGETTLHSEISLPVAKTFNFNVCLKDTALFKAITEHVFEVSSTQNTSVQKLTSDVNGCIHWSEKIIYNHLARAKWVEVTRLIKAVGLHQGQRPVKFALNPWEGHAESLLDIPDKIKQTVKDETALRRESNETESGFWIDDLRLTLSEKEPGALLGLKMRALTSFPLLKADGSESMTPITRGEFQAEFTLINVFSKDGKEIHEVIGATEKPAPAKISGNFLVLTNEAPVRLKKLCAYGQVLLGVRLAPQTKDLKLKPYEGLFTNIGDCDQIKGSYFALLRTALSAQKEGPRTVQEFVRSSLASMDAKETIPVLPTKVLIEEPLRFKDLGYRGDNAYQREKVFSITACLLAPIDHKRLRAQTYVVTKIDGQKETLLPTLSNCVTWNDSVPFDVTQKEGWIQKSFRIQNTLLKLDETLSIGINPWKLGDAAILDYRREQALTNVEGPTKLVMLNYDFDTRDVKYPIDQMLNMKKQMEGILRVTTRLIRPSNQAMTGVSDEAPPAGSYRLRWAIVDGQVKDFKNASGKIYQAGEKVVIMQAGGTLQEPMVFESGNLKSIGNLNQILFEIEPLQNIPNLAQQTFRGALLLADRNLTSNLEVLNEGQHSVVRGLISQFKADVAAQTKIQTQMGSKEHLAASSNLKLINLKSGHGLQTAMAREKSVLGMRLPEFLQNQDQLSNSGLKSWIESGKPNGQVFDQLCNHWFHELLPSPSSLAAGREQAADSCRRSLRKNSQNFLNPKGVLQIEYRYFLKDISTLEELHSEVEDKTVSTAFSLNYSEDSTFTKSTDVSAGLNFLTILSPVNVHGGGRLQWSWQSREGASNTVNVQRATVLTMEKMKFKLRAGAYEKCAIVRLNPSNLPMWIILQMEQSAQKSATAKALARGYLICQGETQKRGVVFEESFTILNQKIFGTQVLNPNSERARPLFIAVRGERDHQKVLQTLSGQIKTPTGADSGYQPRQDLQHLLMPAFQDPMLTFPGQFTSNQ